MEANCARGVRLPFRIAFDVGRPSEFDLGTVTRVPPDLKELLEGVACVLYSVEQVRRYERSVSDYLLDDADALAELVGYKFPRLSSQAS